MDYLAISTYLNYYLNTNKRLSYALNSYFFKPLFLEITPYQSFVGENNLDNINSTY